MNATEFWKHFEKQADGCWLWTGALTSKGYGNVRFEGRSQHVHRVAYALMHGPIADGMQIDHVRARGCVHRHCGNPAHLEPVTPRENTRRGRVAIANAERGAAVTHCPRGHAYSEENTRYGLVRGYRCRQCRACHRERERARYQQRSQHA